MVLVGIHAAAQNCLTAGVVTLVILVDIHTAIQRRLTAGVVTLVVLVGVLAGRHGLAAAAVVALVVLIGIHTAVQGSLAAGVIALVVLVGIHAAAQNCLAAGLVALVILVAVHTNSGALAAAITVVVLIQITLMEDALGEDRKVGGLAGDDRQLSQRLTIGAGSPAGKGVGLAVGGGLGRRSALVDGGLAQQVLLGGSHAIDDPGDLNSVDHDTVAVTLGVPQIVDIAVVVGCAGLSAIGQQEAAVAILQPQRIDEHDVVGVAAAIQAEGQLFPAGAVLQDDLTSLAGRNDLRAAADRLPSVLIDGHGGVEVSLTHHRAIDVQLHILQVTALTDIAAGGGRIAHRDEFLVAENILAPVFQIPQIHIVAAGAVDSQVVDLIILEAALGDHQNGILGHGDLHTGQQGQVLLDGGSTGSDIDGDIAVQGQNEGCGVNLGGLEHILNSTLVLGASQIQCNTGHGGVAVNGDVQAVGGRIVILDDIAALAGNEHTALTDEAHRQTHGLAAGGHGDVNILSSAGIQGQSHFDVLHIVLGEGEGLDVVVGGIAVTVEVEGGVGIHEHGHIGATGEVGDLHDLIDLCTAVGGNSAVTVDIAPGKQVCAGIDGDGGIGVHVNCTVRAAGTTTGVLAALQAGVLGLNIQRTINRHVDAIGHGQGQESVGSHHVGGVLGSHTEVFVIGASGGVLGIHGDQQGDARRNGVITGRQDTALHQSDLLEVGGNSILHSLVQIGKVVSTGHEHRCILRHDHSLNGAGFLKGAGVGHFSTQVGILGHIVPAHQLVAGTNIGAQGVGHAGQIGCSLGRRAGSHSQGLVAIGNGVAAEGGSLEGGGHRVTASAGQNQVGDGDGHGIVLVAGGTGNIQHNLHRLTGSQLLFEGAGGYADIVNGGTAAIGGGDAVIKAQISLCALIVGDGQGGGGVHIDRRFLNTLQRTGNGIAIGSPAGSSVIVATG